MTDPGDQNCARCDEPLGSSETVIVPGLTGSGPAHEHCVPDEYRDFMRIVKQNFSSPPPSFFDDDHNRGHGFDR